MSQGERESRLLQTFVFLLEDHKKDFDGFVRDVENVRFCHTPIDAQQINRCEYSLRNIEIRLLTIQKCIKADDMFEGDVKDDLVKTGRSWTEMKKKVDESLSEIQGIIERTAEALRPVRQKLGGQG